jgi:hypothetical protein
MDWQRIAGDFEPDGSLRDIYVFDTALSDWQRVLDALRTWEPSPNLTTGGRPAALPDDVADIFAQSRQQRTCLAVIVSGVLINCYFFHQHEIEFDLDPREVAGPEQLAGLRLFMSLLGQAARKPVVMTIENMREAVILRHVPHAHELEWVAPQHE